MAAATTTKKRTAKKAAAKTAGQKAVSKASAKKASPSPKPRAAKKAATDIRLVLPKRAKKINMAKLSGMPAPATGHYLTQEQIESFEKLFSKMRSGILHSAERLMDTMKDEVNIISDENDRASKESEFAVELQEREREHRLLNKIQSALNRIQKQTFGYCEECGMPIGYKRLKARPVATLCIECKNLQEQLEKSGSV